MTAESGGARAMATDSLVALRFDDIVNQCELQVWKDHLRRLAHIDAELKAVMRQIMEMEL